MCPQGSGACCEKRFRLLLLAANEHGKWTVLDRHDTIMNVAFVAILPKIRHHASNEFLRVRRNEATSVAINLLSRFAAHFIVLRPCGSRAEGCHASGEHNALHPRLCPL